MERSDFDFTLSIPFSAPAVDDAPKRKSIIEASRAAYAMPRAEIEAELFRKFRTEETPEPVLRTPAGYMTIIEEQIMDGQVDASLKKPTRKIP